MQGIDISSNNHAGEVFNWRQVTSQGYRFVYVKATQGDNYLNPYLVADVRDAANAGLLVGVYHFYDPAQGTPKQQADFFMRNGIHAPVGDQTHGDLSQYLTLMPVLDFETGLDVAHKDRSTTARDEFLLALHRPAGVYMNRSYLANIGYGQHAKFGWLAWPGWTNEQLPSVTAIVQPSQQQVQGIGENPNGSHSTTDIDTCFDITRILDVVPATEKKEEEMDSLEVTIDGTPHIVSHVLTLSGHYLEVVRPLTAVGKNSQGDGTEIIDLTDAYPSISWK